MAFFRESSEHFLSLFPSKSTHIKLDPKGLSTCLPPISKFIKNEPAPANDQVIVKNCSPHKLSDLPNFLQPERSRAGI